MTRRIIESRKRLALAATFLLLLAVPRAPAQGGGKAEPLRVQFKRGSTSTAIRGKIRGTVQAEYVIAARKGQKLTISLTSAPARSAVFDIKAPEAADLGLEYDANYNFSKVLPVTGDYFVTVVRPTQSPGASSYTMTVTIR